MIDAGVMIRVIWANGPMQGRSSGQIRQITVCQRTIIDRYALARIFHAFSVLSGLFARLLRCETLSVLGIYTYMPADDNVPRLAGEQKSALQKHSVNREWMIVDRN